MYDYDVKMTVEGMNMKEKRLPMYLQIFEEFKEYIESGVWEVDSLLLPEETLAKNYNVSRVTMRSALKLLQEKKYIQRTAGFGTTVSYRRPELLNFTLVSSLTNEMTEVGLPLVTLDLKIDYLEAGPQLAKIFQIKETDKLYNIRRIRGPENPLLFSNTYLRPVFQLPETKNELMGSLYQYLSSQNVLFSYFTEVVSATKSSDVIRKYLNISDDIHLLKRKRYAYDENELLIEYTETFYDPDRYEYRTNVHFNK